MKNSVLSLVILKEKHIIDADTFRRMIRIFCFLEEKGIVLSETLSSRFVSHLSMAFMRSRRGESLETLDEKIFQELLLHTYYHQACFLWDQLSFVLSSLDSTEKPYILIIFCQLLSLQQEELLCELEEMGVS